VAVIGIEFHIFKPDDSHFIVVCMPEQIISGFSIYKF
jgi:hypothetical protein